MNVLCMILVFIFIFIGLFFAYVCIRNDVRDEREKREKKAVETEREIRRVIRDEEWEEYMKKERLKLTGLNGK